MDVGFQNELWDFYHQIMRKSLMQFYSFTVFTLTHFITVVQMHMLVLPYLKLFKTTERKLL